MVNTESNCNFCRKIKPKFINNKLQGKQTGAGEWICKDCLDKLKNIKYDIQKELIEDIPFYELFKKHQSYYLNKDDWLNIVKTIKKSK